MTVRIGRNPGEREGKRRPFYGWAVVAAVFVMLTTSSGLGFYALSVYLSALTEERGFSVSSVSGATAVCFLLLGLGGMVAGKLIATRDPRLVMAGGAVVAAGGMSAIGEAERLWQVYAAYALFGAGVAACMLVPATTLVTRWFHRQRSLALSVASTGLSLGGVVVTPLAASLIDARGLASASRWLALAFVVGVVPVTALVVRPSPEAMGLLPDGATAPPDGLASWAEGTTYAMAVRSRPWKAITAAWTLALAAQVGAIAHLVNVGSERLDRSVGTAAISALALSSIVGRLSGGWALPKLPGRTFALACFGIQCFGLVVIGAAESRLALLIGAVVLGVSVGNILMLQPILLAEIFGVRDYPRIYALSQFLSTLGVAGGPVAIGVIHDNLEGYQPAFWLAAAFSVAAALIFAAAGPLTPPLDPGADAQSLGRTSAA